MTLIHLISFAIVICGAVKSFELDSGEANRIEITPIYDTIIFSDVADIINELDNMNPLEAIINSASDSDENVEDLLTEYQHYLDKAHKQRLNYLDKTKSKNKVPLTRRDRFVKTKPGMSVKYDDGYYTNNLYSPNKIAPVSNSALDLFDPLSSRLKLYNKPELSTSRPNVDIAAFDKRLIDLPSGLPKLRHDILKPSCFCKSGQYPCKQCFPFDTISQGYTHNYKSFYTNDNKPQLHDSEYLLDDKTRDINDNTLNIRIKVDIQVPKSLEAANKIFKNKSYDEESISKETSSSSLNIPFPYFNFPIPMDLFGYKKPTKYSKHDSMPLHKITIHKKKKSRLSSNNKKHKKKLITIHNLNLDSQQPTKLQYNAEESLNITGSAQHNELKNNNNTKNSTVPEKLDINTILITNKTDTAPLFNETKPEESFFVTVNMSGFDNGTEENHKTENSLETDFSKTTEKLIILRRKREIGATGSTTTISSDPLAVIPLKSDVHNLTIHANNTNHACCNKSTNTALQHENLDIKVMPDKELYSDTEILYWPNCSKSSNNSVLLDKSITTIILERENKKGKLNFTKEMRNDRTRVLEKAIFGEVNWDDVDTVAPAFMSFVGKYVTGSLTFCSLNVCHSMKCAEKTCVHRTCIPSDRWNQRGHCNGSNNTDSIASLESIMDLPSNIAFEIVDILQDKMLGKLYGKVTLCISTKCISFVANKKSFSKSKCSNKELTKTGHCPNIKAFKNT